MSHQIIPKVPSPKKIEKARKSPSPWWARILLPKLSKPLGFFCFSWWFFMDWVPVGWTSPWKTTKNHHFLGEDFEITFSFCIKESQILWIQVAWVIPEDVPIVSGSFRIERNLTYWMVELFQLFWGGMESRLKHVAGDRDHDEVRSLGSTQQGKEGFLVVHS